MLSKADEKSAPSRLGRQAIEIAPRKAMPNPEISLAISSTCFGLVIGFFAGYAKRAYMSYLRRRAKD